MRNSEQLKSALLAILLAAAGARPAQAQGSNAPPEVSIVWPSFACRYTHIFEYLACLKIKALAEDADGTIAQVQFFVNEMLIGVVTNAPFEMVWESTLTSSRPIKAVAFDNLGASTESDTVWVTFVASFAPPVFEIQSPANGSVFAAPATFVFSAEQMSTKHCGTPPVEFFAGANSLGTVTQSGPFTVSTPPYSLTVTNLPEGSYYLSVRASPFGTATYAPGACQGPVIRVTRLGVASSRLTADNRFQFDVVTSYPTNQNVIEVASSLLNWTPISTNVPFTNTFTFSEPSPATNSPRFYRAVVSSE